MRKKSKTSKGPGFGTRLHAIVKLVVTAGAAFTMLAFAPGSDGRRPRTVRYTDVRQAAGITFLQDGTATDEKYYLETMGTSVAWLDYDQDGLMDWFRAVRATDIYKPPQPLRSALYHNNGDGTFTDVTERLVLEARDTMARELRLEISTTTAIPIST
jgi:hypothetical protein